MPTGIESYKIKYDGGIGTSAVPFTMKAENNDPFTKNYGAVAPGKMRAFGTNDTEFLDQETTDAGTALNYGAAVGSSPAKGLWDKIKKVGKTMLNPIGAAMNLGKNLVDDQLNQGGGGDVAPHGDEAHTNATGEAVGQGVTAATTNPNDPNAVQDTGGLVGPAGATGGDVATTQQQMQELLGGTLQKAKGGIGGTAMGNMMA